MHAVNEKLPEPRPLTNLAMAAAIVDLLLGLLLGALAVALAADNLASIRAAAPDPVTFTPPFPLSAPVSGSQQQAGYSDWVSIVFTVAVGTTAVLFVLAGVVILVRRIAWAARAGEVAVGVSVALIDGSLVHAASTCEEMGCLVVPLASVSVIVVTVVGVAAWLLNHNAHRQLSTTRR